MKKGIFLAIAFVGLIFVGASCDAVTTQTSSYQQESEKTKEVQESLVKSVPIPDLKTSLERKNVAKRAEIFNVENKISYIYLTSFGKVMAFYTVKGKVSSLRSYLTPVDKLVDGNGNPCYVAKPCYNIETPDIDGTYGENSDGIFFFTTDGAYVEWKGEYMMSDQPLKLTTQPELVREVK